MQTSLQGWGARAAAIGSNLRGGEAFESLFGFSGDMGELQNENKNQRLADRRCQGRV